MGQLQLFLLGIDWPMTVRHIPSHTKRGKPMTRTPFSPEARAMLRAAIAAHLATRAAQLPQTGGAE
jgi:hypothetical protein